MKYLPGMPKKIFFVRKISEENRFQDLLEMYLLDQEIQLMQKLYL
jgi:hypothetical protein